MSYKVALALLALWVASGVLAQANRTEKITLKYRSAQEVEQMLLPAPTPEGKGGLRRPGGRSLLPTGIVTFAADAQTATVTASGTVEALGELKKIVRLIDIPKRRLRWTIKALKPDEKLRLAASNADLAPEEIERLVRDAEKRVGLLYETEVDGANSQPVRLLTPNGEMDQVVHSLQGRVNGDGSITLILSNGEDKPQLFRRTLSGRPVMFSPDGGAVLVIRAEIQPAPKLD